MGKINHSKWLYRHYCLLNLIRQGIFLKRLVLLQRCVSNPKGFGTFEQLSNHGPWDFPGGPVVRAPHSQCRGPGSDPWSGN